MPTQLINITNLNLLTMKKTLLMSALISVAVFSNAQNTSSNTNGQSNGQGVIHWKLDGNQAADDHFIGTVNEKPLIFKSNNIEGIRLTPEGDVKLDKVEMIPNHELIELPEVAIIRKDGTVSKLGLGQLKSMIYSEDCFQYVPTDVTNDPNAGTTYKAPSWKSEVGGKLYTGADCPAFVGINTANPTKALHVNGESFFSNNVEILTSSSSADKAFKITQQLGGSDVFRVMGNGKIFAKELAIGGLNNNAETFLIQANGNTWATKFTVTEVSNFPDYVFDNSYKLKPLSEVEAYIKEHKHLPNIPTAKEVEEEGMDLAELTRLQMEKIEELTLYIIELEKRQQKMEEEIEKLKE